MPTGTSGSGMPGRRPSDDGLAPWSKAVMAPAERQALQERATRAWAEARRLLAWADQMATESSANRRMWTALRLERERIKAAERVEEVMREADPAPAVPAGVGLVAAHRTEAVGTMHDLLQTRFARVFAAGDGPTAVGLAIVHQPDVGVLADDLMAISGLEAATVIGLYAPRTRLLLLADRKSTVRRAEALGIAVEPSSAPPARLAAALDSLAC